MTEPKQVPVKAAKKEPRESYAYVGYDESGTWELFSDELEASRFALKGASKARVEKKVLGKRTK